MTLPSGMRLKGGLESCLARTKLSQTKNQKDSSGDSQQTKSSSAYETKKSDAKKQAKDSAQLRNRVRAISLIDGVLTNAAQISSFEYRIRVEIEAAILLWRPDHERSVSILKKTVKSIRDLLDDEQTLKNIDVTRTELQRIKFLAIRKVASLNPDLLKDLIPAATPGNSTTSISGEWTEEARGLMSVASDQLEKDPRGAARLAEQSLRLGLVDWTNFLDRLKKRDSGEAERLTAILIDRLRDSSITPIYLLNLSGFIFGPDSSSQLREQFFQAVAIRIGRDLRPDTSPLELQADLIVSRGMSELAANKSPAWQQVFDSAVSSFERLFTERSLPVPETPGRRMIDMSTMSPAAAANTQAISDALPRVAAMQDSNKRDREYQQLAAKAAANDDLSLANYILSKINDEQIKRGTTVPVYGPLVRKAIDQSDWSIAQKHAANITDPLSRTIVLDGIGQAMSKSREDKSLLINLYNGALSQLENEWSTEGVAKAFLIVSRAFQP
ncbi:MAG TPA: hypothetical protein VKN18_07415, partial [Blastocatellia bacterium]|nr:hypothetical protein [Blastocatellia bacterium]